MSLSAWGVGEATRTRAFQASSQGGTAELSCGGRQGSEDLGSLPAQLGYTGALPAWEVPVYFTFRLVGGNEIDENCPSGEAASYKSCFSSYNKDFFSGNPSP